MAISKDTPRQYDAAVEPIFADIPAKASTKIYEGACLSDDGGNGVADDLAAGEGFLGFAEKQCDNSAGAAGDKNVRIRQKGIIKDLAVTGLDADTDYGVAVYATDNGTFTLTASGAVQIGKVQHYKGNSGYGDVYFEAGIVRSV